MLFSSLVQERDFKSKGDCCYSWEGQALFEPGCMGGRLSADWVSTHNFKWLRHQRSSQKLLKKNYWISRLLNCTFNDTWRCHQFEIFSALLALCEGNPSVVTGGFPSQRPVTRSFDVFFDQRLNKRSSKNRDAGDVRHHRVHCDINVMTLSDFFYRSWCICKPIRKLRRKWQIAIYFRPTMPPRDCFNLLQIFLPNVEVKSNSVFIESLFI